MYSQNTVSLEAAQVKENTNLRRVKKKTFEKEKIIIFFFQLVFFDFCVYN